MTTPPRRPRGPRPTTGLGPFNSWYKTAEQGDYEAEMRAQALARNPAAAREAGRINLWGRIKVVGLVAFGALVLLALLPSWLLLLLVVAGGFHLHRSGTAGLRRVLGPLGRFLLFDNRPVEDRRRVEAFLTRDRTDPVAGADPAAWLQRELDLGRLPSPAKLQARFPGIDRASLGEYVTRHAEARSERRRALGRKAAVGTATGVLQLWGKAIDIDGTRRRARMEAREWAEYDDAVRHQEAHTEWLERQNKHARRSGW